MSATVVPPKRNRVPRTATLPQTIPSYHNPSSTNIMNLQAAHPRNSELDMKPAFQPSTPPRTPRRTDDNQTNIRTTAAAGSGSKQRMRNKNRPKNVMTSPAVSKNDRNTPPLTGTQFAGIQSSAKPISTPSSTAYAGATFHASPAPSTLPIPSFYSKSVPDSPAVKGLKVSKDASPKTSDSPNGLIAATAGIQTAREESPLDLFFKADREEKERARSASSNLTTAATGPFQPPPDSPHHTPSSANQTRSRNRNSSNGIFAMEMDGPSSPVTPIGPAFSTPYSERINAARASASKSQSPSNHGVQQVTDRSEALKAYLFSGRAPQSTSTMEQTQSSSTCHSQSSSGSSVQRSQPIHFHSIQDKPLGNSRQAGRSSGLRKEVTPTVTPTKSVDRVNDFSNSPTPANSSNNVRGFPHDYMNYSNLHTTSTGPASSPFGVTSGNRDVNLQGMEDSLRRILKLEPAVLSGAAVAGHSNLSSAAASTSNYAGERAPPAKGMNNGVRGS